MVNCLRSGPTPLSTNDPNSLIKQADVHSQFCQSQQIHGDMVRDCCIPTLIERDSYNAVEHYQLKDDGTVSTTFTYLKGGFNGPLKSYRPRGFILDHQTNATWGMQFIWPIKADFRIVSLDEQYTQTIVARQKRDYVWLMARTPNISQQDYQKHVHTIESLGYDITKLRKVRKNGLPINNGKNCFTK
ncbi:MAG: hypothetical protein CM1200mP18_05810 [Gammaproteobacteria bacterium]|nr:MAG: hypothetical protein CM1200mP18_05810 [Gammaproteobacteria bacterium]